MQSSTKTKLTNAQITAITRHAFGEDAGVQKITELTDGYFNTAYKVELRAGETAVLKVSPPTEAPVLRYEHNLMTVEVAVLHHIRSLSGVPAPKILYCKQGDNIIENDYFFMEFIDGEPLDKHQKTLSAEQNSAISSDLGFIAKKINETRGAYFGTISRLDGQFTNWRDAFLSMIQDLLADAADAGVTLPLAYDAIYQMAAAQRQALDAVVFPALVHKDLWAGNVFIDPEATQITGIVDFERAIYGDALLEPVCGFLLENEAFMNAYLGRTTLTPTETIRVTLYKIYLFLIMVIECSYRNYSDDGQEKWARQQLDKSLEILAGFNAG
jgi:aminoglycoside phosphotransferase (APT) family kinase protein